jgi:hypothetical protein
MTSSTERAFIEPNPDLIFPLRHSAVTYQIYLVFELVLVVGPHSTVSQPHNTDTTAYTLQV